jgi:RNA polymerase sigma factor (TIGR02999 family)
MPPAIAPAPPGPSAAAQLLPLVYAELRKLAAAKLAREASELILQPTALVHEAWLRLGGDTQPAWQNRAHFFSAAAEAMRRILIDDARKRRTTRHGGNLIRLNFEDVRLAALARSDWKLIDLNTALEKFTRHDVRKAELVKLRYFAGLTHSEAALALGISEVTAKRWWVYARAWLFAELSSSGGPAET